ncbi:hypothetical protein DDZ13_01260 [Coraliomargarita sinensis]|uniref:Uncharacterized protein n=1 Tax=Coraliomargarita sinensis TaxID=2174842 RepID=A0A317ZNU2_9BACT|nr:hypothetical protein [Coraliomargarita sinensis]PXA05529.1 hypothetical protein DDZ13_01260 [Coraliomargarita sinensis]
MLNCFAKSLLFAVCLWLAVGPLALLQLGAWTWMVASYAQDGSLEKAIEETFSDQRPCHMCRLIDAVEEEKDSGSTPIRSKTDQSLKLMLGLSREICVPEPRSGILDTIIESGRYDSFNEPVPTPPPRSRA